MVGFILKGISGSVGFYSKQLDTAAIRVVCSWKVCGSLFNLGLSVLVVLPGFIRADGILKDMRVGTNSYRDV